MVVCRYSAASSTPFVLTLVKALPGPKQSVNFTDFAAAPVTANAPTVAGRATLRTQLSPLLAPPKTVAIGFSHSGATADTVRYLEIARSAGALTVAITGSPASPLAEMAEERLISHARESQLRAGAMVSRIAQLSIVDCLFLGVAQQRYDQSILALQRTRDITHPAG